MVRVNSTGPAVHRCVCQVKGVVFFPTAKVQDRCKISGIRLEEYWWGALCEAVLGCCVSVPARAFVTFLLVACPSIYCLQAVAAAQHALFRSRDAETAARALVSRAQRLESTDNITVVTLAAQPATTTASDASAATGVGRWRPAGAHRQCVAVPQLTRVDMCLRCCWRMVVGACGDCGSEGVVSARSGCYKPDALRVWNCISWGNCWRVTSAAARMSDIGCSSVTEQTPALLLGAAVCQQPGVSSSLIVVSGCLAACSEARRH